MKLVVLFRFFVGYFHTVFNVSSHYQLAFKKLISTSFNVPEIHRYQFKTVISGIKKIYVTPVITLPIVGKNSTLVYDVNNYSKNHRLQYLYDFNPHLKDLQFISGDEFNGYISFTHKLLFLFISLPIQFLLIILGLIKKDKSGVNSVLNNLLITQNVISTSLKFHCKEIILFCVYDTNSAFLSLNLQKSMINVTTVTSEVPLYKWNKIIITDILHLCSEYQLQELKYLSNIRYKSYRLGAPESYFEVKHLYTQPAKLNSKLGFISTGGWVRNKLGHINQGIDIEFFEAKILTDLNVILEEYKHIELIIYPHPREVKYFNSSIEDLTNFYKQWLATANFSINASNKSTNQLFDETFLSLCFMSTTIFERLHAKRKSAIVYFKEDIFPVDFSSDYLHFISNEHQLKQLINRTYNSN